MLLAYKKSSSFSLKPRPTVSFSSKGQVVAKSGTLYYYQRNWCQILTSKIYNSVDIYLSRGSYLSCVKVEDTREQTYEYTIDQSKIFLKIPEAPKFCNEFRIFFCGLLKFC